MSFKSVQSDGDEQDAYEWTAAATQVQMQRHTNVHMIDGAQM
jgi:hypothetical protein